MSRLESRVRLTLLPRSASDRPASEKRAPLDEAERDEGGREPLAFRSADGRARAGPAPGTPDVRRLGEWIEPAGEVGYDAGVPDEVVDGPAEGSMDRWGRSLLARPRSEIESGRVAGWPPGLARLEPEVAEDWLAELSPEAVLLVRLSGLNSPEGTRDGPRGEGTGDESPLRRGWRDGGRR